jgi:HK97 family phage major capsid protein/HK97 family phage prohead protease
VNKAYSLLHVKAVDPERRVITGIATTPEPDRSGDIIEPLGVSFKNPLPLLLFHDAKKPVGFTTFDKPTKTGIGFTATLPTIDEPGTLKDRVDEAWQSVKAGLVSGVSIGFRSLEDAFMKDGGIHFLKTEVVELSLVTVPANASTTIHSIKALDLAASGRHLPGATGDSTVVRLQKAAPNMTIPEQITQFENQRAAQAAIRDGLMTKAAETGESLDQEQSDTYTDADRKVKSIDLHLERLRDLEKSNLANATRITSTTNPVTASDLRGSTATTPVITVKSPLPKGTAFARMCMALGAGHGDSYQTLQIAKQWHDSTPEVEQMVQHMWRTKAAVAAGTTTDSTWAGPLAVTQPLNDFLELLRPRTLLGRIPGLKRVPFNISVPSQTAGGTYGWVGQGLAKAVTKPAYATVTLPFAKAAGIIVLTEELVKLSTPSAEALVTEEMIAGMAQFLDTQFVDPTVAVAANVSPASITNGATTFAASGTTGAAARTDISTMMAAATAANVPLEGSVLLMSETTAFSLGLALNALGQLLFAGVGINGGNIMGAQIIVSNNVGNRIILMHPPSILFADEGGVQIDVSREASVQMDSAPDSPATASTVLVSLWQNNLVGLRAERMITWIRARTAAVRYISGVAYVA